MLGFEVVRNAIPSHLIKKALDQAIHVQATAAKLLAKHGPLAVEDALIAPIRRFAATAASVNADALDIHQEILTSARERTHDALARELGTPVCDLDLSWLRKQYPPTSRPQFQAPHSWHQDGACGLDLNRNQSKDPARLSKMITLWIPLNDCGKDAPSLEVLTTSPQALVHPLRLSRIHEETMPQDRRGLELQAGDIVLMAGHCIHRTYVTQQMNSERHCIEFRFFDLNQRPARFKNHTFV